MPVEEQTGWALQPVWTLC